MKRTFAAFAAVSACLALIPSLDGLGMREALAQSNPCFNPGSGCRALQTGDVPTATQWNSFFTAKQDFLGGGANLFLATPNGSSGSPGLRAIVPADIPGQVAATMSASGTIAAAGVYAVTTVGITVTLPASSTLQGPVVIKDMTGSPTPNITIAGNVDGSAGGTSIANPHQALTFSPAPTLSTWIIQ